MATANVTGTIITTGYNCQVHVKMEESSTIEAIALVASFQATEDFQAHETSVIGYLGPVSIDPQGYTCTITLDGFLPSKKILNDAIQYENGGKKAIADYIPTREKYMDAGAIPKFDYLDFYNKKEAKVLACFEGVLITSDGVNVEGNSYVRNNVQMRALSKN
jgi:hypothetical protein